MKTWLLGLVLSFFDLVRLVCCQGTTIDLGYSVYTGVSSSSTSLTTWKGIRYAAPPIGSLRWQAPQAPTSNPTVVVADRFGPACPQAYPALPGMPFTAGNEDCLYLNVWTPTGSIPSGTAGGNLLPVLVSIHGGGYGLGDGTQDMSGLMNANNNTFLVVSIQYRVYSICFVYLLYFER
jgi:carboxylesterase type B